MLYILGTLTRHRLQLDAGFAFGFHFSIFELTLKCVCMPLNILSFFQVALNSVALHIHIRAIEIQEEIHFKNSWSEVPR